jgi:hypothetical protein
MTSNLAHEHLLTLCRTSAPAQQQAPSAPVATSTHVLPPPGELAELPLGLGRPVDLLILYRS